MEPATDPLFRLRQHHMYEYYLNFPRRHRYLLLHWYLAQYSRLFHTVLCTMQVWLKDICLWRHVLLQRSCWNPVPKEWQCFHNWRSCFCLSEAVDAENSSLYRQNWFLYYGVHAQNYANWAHQFYCKNYINFGS